MKMKNLGILKKYQRITGTTTLISAENATYDYDNSNRLNWWDNGGTLLRIENIEITELATWIRDNNIIGILCESNNPNSKNFYVFSPCTKDNGCDYQISFFNKNNVAISDISRKTLREIATEMKTLSNSYHMTEFTRIVKVDGKETVSHTEL